MSLCVRWLLAILFVIGHVIVPVCSMQIVIANETTAPLCKDDSTSMLQVFHDVEVSNRAAHKHGHEVFGTSILDETASCIYYSPLNLMIIYDSLRLFQYIPSRPRCKPPDPTAGVFKLALNSELARGNSSYITKEYSPMFFPAFFLLVFFILLMRMLFKIMCAAPMSKSTWKSDQRPESDSWSRGIIAWLYVDFVDEWVARWGNLDESDRTRIHVNELGRLGDPDDDCEQCFERLEALWNAEIRDVGIEKANVMKVLCRYITWNRLICLCIWTVFYEMFMYVGPPMAMTLLIRTMEDIYLTRLQGGHIEPVDLLPATFVAAVLFTGIPIFCGISNTFTSMLAMRMSVRIAGGLSCLVYRKAQRLPGSSQMQVSREEEDDDTRDNAFDPQTFSLIQVVSSDCQDSLMALPLQGSKVLITFPIICLLFVALAMRIGATIIACIVMCFFSTFLMLVLIISSFQHQTWFLFWAGKRLRFIEELLQNIQTVKACGWQPMSMELSTTFREKELEHLGYNFWYLGWSAGCLGQYPNLITVVCLWGYMWFNGKTEMSHIWTLLPLLYTFQSAIFSFVTSLPAAFSSLPSLLRVQAFLKMHEAPNGIPRSKEVPHWMHVWPVRDPRLPPEDPSMRVQVQGSFSWKRSLEPTLKDIDLVIPAGGTLCILGSVGSGKSALLMAMLGELYPCGDSRISVPSRMAFSAQAPFITEGTLRGNIVSSNPFNAERYHACIYAAGLCPDLEVLPGGDEVPIGSRGISLSGGQKARVSMARAAYMNVPLVIVDDPFSAVDSRTGRHILDHYVFGSCLKGITRVIVTQPDAERIKRFDQVVIVSEGRIVVNGPPDEVMKTDEYRSLLSSGQKSNPADGVDAQSSSTNGAINRLSPRGATDKTAVNPLREEEFEGRPKWNNIAHFIGLGGVRHLFIYLLGAPGVIICALLSKVVLQDWANHEMLYKAHRKDSPANGFTYLPPYAFWCGVAFLWHCICWYQGIQFTIGMSKHNYAELLEKLLCAPVDYFYNKTPVGRIMNRLGTDVMNLDRFTFLDVGMCIIVFWSQILPLVYVHILMPVYFTIVSIPLYLFLVFVMRRFANTMIPMRYLTSVCKSASYMCLTEVDMSLPSLRAAQSMDSQLAEFMDKLGASIRAQTGTETYTKRWVIQRLFLLIAFYMTLIVFICIWVPGTMSFGSLALCLSNMLQICVGIEGIIDYCVKAQIQMISMNRVHEYTMLPQEKPNFVQGDRDLTSFTVWLSPDSLAGLAYDNKCTSNRITIWYKTSSEAGRRVVLVQKPGSEEFVAFPGKTLAVLKPDDEQLQRAGESHLLAEVNETCGNAVSMAQELCSAASGGRKKVRLHIKSGWLADGARVVIQNLTAGYGDLPRDILKDVSLSIEPCTNVGFVGATGCGKSTLLLCMLRILESRWGSIIINDVNIGDIGLQTLRSAVGLVPQDPVVMNSSVRSNLDPFNFYTDSQLWEGLRMVGLEEQVRNMPDQMATLLAGDGAHLSFGQRQLLCMARLVVRQPSLILLDEATSALDPRTQEVVQKTVESRFPRSTLMVVAHRLETILGFDKVFVMQLGRIAEQGPVQELAAIKGGIFAGMLAAKQTG